MKITYSHNEFHNENGALLGWASPPCKCFSVASISTHWMGGKKAYIPKTKEAKISIELVKKVLYLIQELKPDYWFIENPRGVLRKMPFMIKLSKKHYHHEISYCKYGDNRMKPDRHLD